VTSRPALPASSRPFAPGSEIRFQGRGRARRGPGLRQDLNAGVDPPAGQLPQQDCKVRMRMPNAGRGDSGRCAGEPLMSALILSGRSFRHPSSPASLCNPPDNFRVGVGDMRRLRGYLGAAPILLVLGSGCGEELGPERFSTRSCAGSPSGAEADRRWLGRVHPHRRDRRKPPIGADRSRRLVRGGGRRGGPETRSVS